MTDAARPGTPRARRGRGVLTVVAGLLVASGLVRIGDEAQAFATGADVDAQPAFVAATGEENIPTDSLLAAFQARDERLTLREAQLADRMQALHVIEADIAKRLVELELAESSLSAILSVAQTAAEADIDQLVAVYQSMKPADAAALFEEMPPQFAAGFVARMDPEAAAIVMSGLEPATAYSISVVLAGRNANVPTQ